MASFLRAASELQSASCLLVLLRHPRACGGPSDGGTTAFQMQSTCQRSRKASSLLAVLADVAFSAET
eukprot:310831-Amphidinium_carterae.1